MTVEDKLTPFAPQFGSSCSRSIRSRARGAAACAISPARRPSHHHFIRVGHDYERQEGQYSNNCSSCTRHTLFGRRRPCVLVSLCRSLDSPKASPLFFRPRPPPPGCRKFAPKTKKMQKQIDRVCCPPSSKTTLDDKVTTTLCPSCLDG